MSARQPAADAAASRQATEGQTAHTEDSTDLFGAILQGAAATLGGPHPTAANLLVGELVGLRTESPSALVMFPGLEGVAAAARSVVDLHGAHIGKPVLLMFDQGDAARPIVMGVLRDSPGWPTAQRPRQIEIDADGERLVVGAKQQLVLRCGAASITLESDGKVSIRGTQIVSEAEGTNRIRGGSVQLN